ncbi:PPK2 family polyphosphate kinase [Teichococcus vastitatis]|uniref:Polyphosphate kinase 2 family protein n=1 Tax=Teichococcus vastitatis TaxID=2307076 RepID=A0ABS9W7H6_9PROT|nr:PPK2 family polyphosphate kinase [Pseudoroseomonas vastitatis]MCI0755254.1 polyphosphate kinase 2 family protein [Pseudoroseomonas vastitatis]
MPRQHVRALLARCRITDGAGFRLADHSTGGGDSELRKANAPALLQEGVEVLAGLQDRMAAQDRHAVLAIFQAMDAAGKDGAIKHAFTGLNPQGCLVYSFKAPGREDLDRDFLRRHVRQLPARGQIGIHNRSWYEEVLVARVHPAILARQNLPPEVISDRIWDERLEDIAAFERYLGRQGFVVLKFFLHLGRDEQRKRLLARIEEPEKNWKLEASDVAERRYWDDYQAAYEAAIRATASPAAPWFVIPADRKWLTRLLVVEAMIEALEAIDPRYPELDEAGREQLRAAAQALQRKDA